MMTRVYFNLHKKLFSIQQKVNGKWKVIDHVDSYNLSNVTFKVYEAGRQRVLKEKRKTVHAYLIGKFSLMPEFGMFPAGYLVRYNPYEMEKFTKDTNEPIDSANFVNLTVINNKPIIIAY